MSSKNDTQSHNLKFALEILKLLAEKPLKKSEQPSEMFKVLKNYVKFIDKTP